VLLFAFLLYFVVRAATAPVVPQPLLVSGLFAGYVGGAGVVEAGVFAGKVAVTRRRRSAGQGGGGLATEDGNVAAAYQSAV
jgi:hypothetical protein